MNSNMDKRCFDAYTDTNAARLLSYDPRNISYTEHSMLCNVEKNPFESASKTRIQHTNHKEDHYKSSLNAESRFHHLNYQ